MTTTDNTDPLIAEIEKRITELDELESKYDDYGEFEQCRAFARQRSELKQVIELVKQDRQRQQAEKERMIAELEAKKYKPATTPQGHGYNGGLIVAQSIIQGKEQEKRADEKE